MLRSMLFVLVLGCLFFGGCTQRVMDFTVLSSKNFDVSRGGFRKASERTSGIDKRAIIVFIPTGSVELKEALDAAIEKVPGCVGLADGVVYYSWWYIPYIYGEYYYKIEGTPILE